MGRLVSRVSFRVLGTRGARVPAAFPACFYYFTRARASERKTSSKREATRPKHFHGETFAQGEVENEKVEGWITREEGLWGRENRDDEGWLLKSGGCLQRQFSSEITHACARVAIISVYSRFVSPLKQFCSFAIVIL